MDAKRPAPAPADDEVDALQAAGDDRAQVLAQSLERHRERLLRMVEIRMHPALRGRVGASDVLQEAYIDISGRLGDYLDNPRMPFFLWIRFLTAQKLMALHRRHLGAKKRDARRQVPIHGGRFPQATSVVLADFLAAQGTTPTQAAVRGEMQLQLVDAIESMDVADREVLALRHFEELTNPETARELGISEAAASKRHLRALARLRGILQAMGAPPEEP